VAGATLLIWAALALVVTVERCFNRIWRIGAGRKWHLRVPVYWSVLTLGSVLLWASFTLTASVVDWARGVPFLGPVVAAASGLGGLVASFLLLLLMYRLMPNTKVQMRPAIVGALVAAVLLEAAKWGFGLYVNNAIGLKNVYGSLAAIPLFLFWVYIIWLIVLFGMELTATLQLLPDQPARNPKRRSADDDELHPDPRLMVPLMTAIGLAFERGEAVDDSVLANRLNIAPRVVLALGQCLVGAGLLHRVEGDSPGYALARPPQRIGLGQVLDAGDCLRDRGEEQDLPGGGALRRLRDAQRGALDQVALSDVLDEEHAADLPDTAGGR
jgi:membrane protein